MRDANGLETIDGAKYIASVPYGEMIIGMHSAGDQLYVATDKHIYKLVNDRRLEHFSEAESSVGE